VESVIFLGRKNIAFRGHRYDGVLEEEVGMPFVSEGNFREVMRYWMLSGDSALKSPLEKAKSDARYSRTTQNELNTECYGEKVRSIILKRIEPKYYCVTCDETRDISCSSQLTLCVPYVYQNSRHENFAEFLNVQDPCFEGMSSSYGPKVNEKALGQLIWKVWKNYSQMC